MSIEVKKAVLPVVTMRFWQLRDLCNSLGIDPRFGGDKISQDSMLSALGAAGVSEGEVRLERPARAAVASVSACAAGVVSTPAVSFNPGGGASVGGGINGTGAGGVGSGGAVVDDDDIVDPFDDDEPVSSGPASAQTVSTPAVNGHNGHAVNGGAIDIGGLGGDKTAALSALLGLLSGGGGISESRASEIASHVVASSLATFEPVVLDKVSSGVSAIVAGIVSESEARTSAAIASAVESVQSAPRVIEIVSTSGADPVSLGVQHKMFPLLLKCLQARVPVFLVGEAGSGKTTAVHTAADALGLPFEPISFCQLTSKADLLGYTDIHREYQSTAFRRAYESGGVFCADEFDSGNPNATMVLNAGLSNGVCGFPDRVATRHQEFRAVAIGNTYGRGADARFVGRNKMDAATLDRFAVLRWDIDPSFVASMAGISKTQESINLEAGGVVSDAGAWFDYVESVRAAFQSLQLEHIISPRAFLAGLALFGVGVGRTWVEELLIYKGMESETRAKVSRVLASS